MKLFINLIRNLLGAIIAFFDVITRGTKLKRSPEKQVQVAEESQKLALYQFFGCPFCIKTRRAMYKYNVPIQKRNVSEGSPHREELLQGGGKIQTPCLRIENEKGVEWMYDSKAIIGYLEERFVEAK
ncbi:MAG: glutathione S-transferase N-terminal domain-containing protein [Alteromonas sp.]|jgi:glutaredoxin|uniref:glutathione S-transferase N-terminal domain-containing protein n=1 Tax=unclassified Alteromonas TaxID=2614992 RepID=UPI0005096352|nr:MULTISPECIES: glutathione S-transferase N-terminal domain-containing protein [unclassified Alteromonas]